MEVVLEFEKPITILEKKILELREQNLRMGSDFSKKELSSLEKQLTRLTSEIFSNLSPWQRVQLSRHPARPYALDYIQNIFSDFVELHGDRLFGDDQAMVGGLGRLGQRSVVVIGLQKGRNTREKVARNFGMAKPEGYRKALRLMELAAQFHLPIITLVDTPGAYPGVEAEERGQARAIADNILKMFDLPVPIIATIIGEGGSGGALALAIADTVCMQEFATYSVISPESCASILWSDSSMAETAAGCMKMTAPHLKELGIIDEIVAEPQGGAHRNTIEAAKLLEKALSTALEGLLDYPSEKLIARRREKFRKLGHVLENVPMPTTSPLINAAQNDKVRT